MAEERRALQPAQTCPTIGKPAADKAITVWECVQHVARVLNAEDGGGEGSGASPSWKWGQNLQMHVLLRYIDAMHQLLKLVKAPASEVAELKKLPDAQRQSGLARAPVSECRRGAFRTFKIHPSNPDVASVFWRR